MNPRRFETQFFIGLLIITSVLIIYIFLPVLSAVIFAVTLSILFHSIYLRFRKVMPKMEGIAAMLTVLLAIITILVPLTYLGIRIFQEAQGLYINLASGNTTPFLELVRNELQNFAPWFNFDLSQFVKQFLAFLLDYLGLIIGNLMKLIGTFLLSSLAMYYFLKDGEKIIAVILKNSPFSYKRSEEIIAKLYNMISSVIGGMLVGAILEGLFVGLGFLIFGLPGALLWGLVAVIAALVPIFGITLVIVPGIISFLLLGNQAGAIGFAITEFAMMAIMENFVKPRFVVRNTNVHPLLVLFSVIGGIVIFGPAGVLLGPLALSFFMALLEIYPKIILTRNSS